MLRAILFDFNGTLVDDEPIHFELLARVAEEEGLTLGEEDYFENYLAFDDRGCFARLLAAAGEEPEPGRIARLTARKASYYRDRLRDQGYPFFDGAVDLIREVAAAGLTLGIVSGAPRQEIDPALKEAGIRALFKTLVAADDVAESKPDPESYLRALTELNARPPLPERLFHPHEVLAVEDAPPGIEAARRAGLPVLGIAHTYRPVQLGNTQGVVERIGLLTVDRLRGLHAREAAS